MVRTLEKNEFYTTDLMDYEKCKEILIKAANQPSSCKILSVRAGIELCREIEQRILFDEVRIKIQNLIKNYE